MSIIYAAHLFAQEAQDETPIGAAFTVSAGLVAFVLATVIPVGTALLTKLGAHPFVKYVTTAVLAALTTIANAAVTNNGVAVISWNTTLLAIGTLIVAIVQYKALWQPAFNINAKVAPNFGLGKAA